ncbi:hypothetical protein T05_5723 [Trichinella murrelli]|uniref:Uncharacterized protein n=1 Tax=Trichinella murrelli TaxID=144512 RepID=A0A0V0T8W3_9BILA|nr:hypothetical protein T05_5723 [Trichinella murrelli]
MISLKNSVAQVAICKDDGNGDLDCCEKFEKFFVYKPPTLLSTKIIKSERNPTWGNSAANIDQNAGHSIRRTMENFIANNGNINVLAYSDDPPNLPPMNEKSKAKGYLEFEQLLQSL